MTFLQTLALCRIRELQEEALQIQGEMEKWRETPFTSVERTKMSVEFKDRLEEADTWMRAVLGEDWRVGYYPAKLEENSPNDP